MPFSAMKAGIHQQPCCPRCGYDLVGDGDFWKDACPLEMICPECGFRVDLIDVLGREQVPGWFIGVGQGWWGMLRRGPGTALRMVVPFHRESRLRLAHLHRSFSDRALVVWLLSLLLLAVSAVAMSTIMIEGANAIQDLRLGRAKLQSASVPADDRNLATLVLVRCSARLQLVGKDLASGFPTGSRWNPNGMNLSRLRRSVPDLRGGPTDLWESRWPLRRVTRMVSPPASVVVLAVILSPLTLLLLPWSLRKCQVSPRQILRLACLSLALLLIPVVVESIVALFTAEPRWFYLEALGRGDRNQWWSQRLGPLLLLALLFFWWIGACRLLGLPRAPWIALAMVVIGSLLAMALLGPESIRMMLSRR